MSIEPPVAPDVSTVSQLFGGTFKSLDAVTTDGYTTGAKVDFLHKATGALLTYVLVAGAADPLGGIYKIAPFDYNENSNNVHWSLEKIFHGDYPALYNPDIADGAGGFNIQEEDGAEPPNVVLDATKVIRLTDFN